MSRRPRTPQPEPHDYTPDIDQLHHRLTALTQRWQGVAPTPPSLAEAVEELATTIEELHAINDDLTQSQQATIESQRRYQELFEGVPEAYLVTDLHGLIREANRPAAHLFNIDRSQLAGLPLAVFIVQDMRRSFGSQLAWLRNGVEVREWVVGVQPRHRSAVTVVCHVAPALDADGAPVGLRWLLRDLKAQPQVQDTVEPRGLDRTIELAHANAVLQAKLDQAVLHMRELHHRMRNNLQVVSSLLDLRAKDLQDPRVSAMVQECQGRIRAMALVHKHLYLAGDVQRLALGTYLRRLALQLFEAYGIDRERIPLVLRADDVEVGINTAVPCGLLVHEVLANCLQHAFPAQQGGVVMVTLEAEPAGQVTLTIRDTGTGVPADLESGDGQSFGLQLIRALTEQLQGTLIVRRDGGTCVTLRFPAATAVMQN
jgi:PAS domain S-box-containing protein